MSWFKKQCLCCNSINYLDRVPFAYECWNCKRTDWIDDESMYEYMCRYNLTLNQATYNLNNAICDVVCGEPNEY